MPRRVVRNGVVGQRVLEVIDVDAVVGVEKLLGIGIAQVPDEAMQARRLSAAEAAAPARSPGTLTL